jgi:hypothetical protein
MKKIVFSFFTLLILLTSVHHLSATSTPPSGELPPPPRQVFTNETFVYNLSIPEGQYKAGDEISGTFTIKNASDNYLDKVQYLVYIAGDIDTNFNHNGFGEVYSSTFGLNGKEFKKVPFTFSIPSVLPSGPKELVVKSLYNGVPYGMAHVPLTINEAKQPFLIEGGGIVVNKRFYSLSNGPTVYKDRDGYLQINLLGSSEVVTVYPKVILYKDAVTTGNEIFEKDLPSFVLGTTTARFEYKLPTDHAPGIYEAEVLFVDDAREVRNRFVAHYIVGGDIATIQSVSFDTTPVTKGTTLSVTSTITGKPVDIVDDAAGTTTMPVVINVAVKNGAGKTIGSSSVTKNIGEVDTIVVSVPIEKNAEIFSVVVEARTVDGTLLSTFSRASDERFYDKNFLEKILTNSMVLIGILAFLMLGIFLITRKFFGKRGTIYTSLLFLAIISSFAGGISVDASSVTISSPFEDQEIVAGSSFLVTGNVVLWQCRNEPTYYSLSHSGIRTQDQGYDAYRYLMYTQQLWGDGPDHEMTSYSGNFSKTYVAPSIPGSYYFCFGARDWRTNDDGIRYDTMSYSSACRWITVTPSPCGSAESATSPEFPTSDLCDPSYTASNSWSNDIQHSWSCSTLGGQEFSCSANRCESGLIWDGASCVLDETNWARCNNKWDITGSQNPPGADRCTVGQGSPVTTYHQYISGGEGYWLHRWSCALDENGSGFQECSIFRCPVGKKWDVRTSTCITGTNFNSDIDFECGPQFDPMGLPFLNPPNTTACLYKENGGNSYGGSVGSISIAAPGLFTWECSDPRGGPNLSCSAARRIMSVDETRCDTRYEYWKPNPSIIPDGGTCEDRVSCNLDTYPGDGGYYDIHWAFQNNFQSFWDTNNEDIDDYLCGLYSDYYGIDVINKSMLDYHYTWTCSDRNDPLVNFQWCEAYPQLTGACGTVANTCLQGKLDTTYPDDTLYRANWSCMGINGATSQTSCGLDCPVGQTVVDGTCSAAPVDGECSANQNQCEVGTSDQTIFPDAPTSSNWSCLGINTGNTASCSFPCPSGQTVVNNVCQPPVVGACTPVITATQQTKMVNPGNSCSMNWSFGVSGGAECATATTECRLDGVVVTPSNTTFDIGTHTLTCTTTLGANSWSATLNPSPQCRLNPNYGEF